jgi:outer membrane protein assembly factor BamB
MNDVNSHSKLGRDAVIACIGVALVTASALGQRIDSLSDVELPRSERLVIRGSGFGAMQGTSQVTIGGIDAPISFWSLDSIHAYVPESTPVGTRQVQVHVSASSNQVPLRVTLRPPPDGRIRWRFRADANMLRARPAVGPDGTVYFTSLYGHMYAVAADGGLRWIRRAYGNTAPSVDANGIIYVGGGGGVQALRPDGSTLWQTQLAGTMMAGPDVGPDGNIYGATGGYSGAETGAFVLSPTGNLLFSYPGLNFRASPAAWNVSFGGNGKWYVTSGMGWPTVGFIGMLSFDLGGGFNWMENGLGQTAAGASGNVYVNNPQGNAITSYDSNGSARWHVTLNALPGGSPNPPTLGPDETMYVPTSAAWYFNAIDAQGNIKWSVRPHDTAAWPTVRPDNKMIVTGGYAPRYVELHTVQAFDPQNGDLLWSVDLPFADASWKVAQQWFGAFASDDRTIYIPTSGTEAGEPFSFLYAINAADSCFADCDQSTGPGVLDVFDFLCFQDSFVKGEPYACDCDTSTGPGVCDVFDFLCFQNAFVSGCP